MHCGKARHGAAVVTRGTRYILLTGFMAVHSPAIDNDFHPNLGEASDVGTADTRPDSYYLRRIFRSAGSAQLPDGRANATAGAVRPPSD